LPRPNAIVKPDGKKRFIGKCTTPGLDIEMELVRSGWALVRSDFITDSARLQALCAVEAEARARKRGLWQGTFELPYIRKGGIRKSREEISCPRETMGP
jgi:endonuclease YncB( thermonuclease family)